MVIRVLKNFILKCGNKTLEFKKGELYQFLDLYDLVADLIRKGLIIPEELHNHLDWCLYVCMLTEGQAKLCERASSCWRFDRERFIETFIKKDGKSSYHK